MLMRYRIILRVALRNEINKIDNQEKDNNDEIGVDVPELQNHKPFKPLTL